MKMTKIKYTIDRIIDEAKNEGCAKASLISKLSIKDIFDIEMYLTHKLNVRYWFDKSFNRTSTEINSSKTVYGMYIEITKIPDKNGDFLIPRWGLYPITECPDPLPKMYEGMV